MNKIDTLTNIKSAFSPKRHELSKSYIEILAKVLNELHNTSYSLRFWTFLLQGYVGSVISNLELYGQKDFVLRITNDYESSFGRPSIKIRLQKSIIATLKFVKSLGNKKKLFGFIKSHNSLHIGFPNLKEVDDDLGQRLPQYQPVFNFRSNKILRQKLERIACNHPDLVVRNIINNMPKIYVEGFKSTLESIPLISPKNKEFHFHNGSISLNFLLAKYTESGAKLYWYQHGAYYGEMEYGSHVRERELADVYRTWGWKIEEKDEPWKAYRLIAFLKTLAISDKKKEFDLLVPLGVIGLNFEARTKNLLSELNREKYPKILFRPRPTNKIFSNKHKITFVKGKGLSVSSGMGSIGAEMEISKLVIQFKVPATNFLECLLINHPTIGIMANNQPTEEVKPFYDFFLKTGVLHSNVNSLVQHLNSVDIEEWWREVTIQPDYVLFKETFLRVNM